ncbi:hypothetical protein AV530_009764 [Patagioenas fasciata monilis]|uniref:Uncharacterized protein n=1 Tax=Patagioenas fasciata monilis TaxID=372326 RepID=A0A1V4KA74_PATFA|nr:hypothetical protein AV530_009764 [Patagioenas fasciata monilis]
MHRHTNTTVSKFEWERLHICLTKRQNRTELGRFNEKNKFPGRFHTSPSRKSQCFIQTVHDIKLSSQTCG